MTSINLIRRNGNVATWNPEKIFGAVNNAFVEITGFGNDSVSRSVADAVTLRVAALGQEFVHIEDVQDCVQEELMKTGQYKVAEHYIVYRAKRNFERESVLQASHDNKSVVTVLQSDGTTKELDLKGLKKRIAFAGIGLNLCLTDKQILQELQKSLHGEYTKKEVQDTIILNAQTLLEKDADFSYFVGRILLSYIYEEVLGWDVEKDNFNRLKQLHKQKFAEHINRGISLGLLSQLLRQNYDFDILANSLDVSADLNFDFMGIKALYDRYLLVDKTGAEHVRLEVPQFMWLRVAMGLGYNEKDKEKFATDLYELYKTKRFCSSTPTLFNAGTPKSQNSSCYLYTVGDSIESIFQRGIADNAYLSKWAGGLGGSWTQVRGTNSHIKGTNGPSQGVIPFLKIYNDMLCAVDQGSKRKGAGCVYLETWHSDIFEFLELRKNVGDERRRTHDTNTANWIPDLFMQRMEARQNWTLFHSNQVPMLHETYGEAFETLYIECEEKAKQGLIYGKQIPAIELWKAMLKCIFETGQGWLTWKDACNVRSPQDHVGIVHSSNLCTEIVLNTSESEVAVCNLGSIVLDSHFKADGTLDYELLADTTKRAVRALDNVVDINFYPISAAENSNKAHRPVGLGIMGLQNALYKMGYNFDSEAAYEFSDHIMEYIAFHAYNTSSDLALEKGPYSSFKGSKWDRGILPHDSVDLLSDIRGIAVDVPKGGSGLLDWSELRKKIQTQGMRNSNVIAIAPTATISSIMGTSPCIEPYYKNIFTKSNLSGNATIVNPYLVKDLKALNLWDDEMVNDLKYFDGELDEIKRVPDDIKAKFKTAFGVPSEAVIESAARRQKWIDQSQSVNLWLKEPDITKMSHMYRLAWRKGLKTTYYLRTLGASGVEKMTVKKRTEDNQPELKEEIVLGKACSLDNPDCESCQ